MKKGIVTVLVSIFLILMASPTTAYALSCVEMPTGEQGYEEYDGIIIGQVEDVVREKEDNIIKLKVIKSFKKIEEEQLSVKENVTWGSLRGPSEIGEEYLYYLRESDNGWENPLCSPTMKVADATEEFIFLKDKEVPIQRVSAPTELGPDDKPSQASKTNESITKSTSTNWTGIVIIVGLAGGVLFVLWRLRSIRK
ncbi:hypothetical protein ACP8HI_20125 [Paenibacillus sp. FA6]|uniref:hypothetical protein n=1 Tax=Paenibacillus sp. FA6 TaxID=3413029 RepID=UPI003F65E806